MNLSVGDFHLKDSSPCIDAGTNDGAPPKDKTGKPRPRGMSCDLGAYETRISHVYPGQDIQSAIDSEDADTIRNIGTTIIIYPGQHSGGINFKGKAITVRSIDPDDPNIVQTTIIDGGGTERVVTFNHGETSESILSGLTLRNGSADHGGGILCDQADPTIINCNIIQNYASLNGGGVRCERSYSEFINCNFSNNSCGSIGGGILCASGSYPKFTNCTIVNNSADFAGSGISSWDNSIPEFDFCTIAGNSGGLIGAIYLYYNSSEKVPKFSNCIIWNNSTPEIYREDSGRPTVTYSDIKGDYTGIGNIDSNPLFTDPALKNYHLQADSNCI